MNNSSTETNERPRSRKLIEDLLQERQQMLVLLWELSKLDFANVDETMLTTLEDFQEILVDYIAAGHFGLYQRITEGNERRATVLHAARETYPSIASTTDVVVNFTEKYDQQEKATISTSLTTDLSKLAEAITNRVELEDQLILAMLGENFQIPDAARA